MEDKSIDGMFEKASRQKLRFPYQGSISVEDLWDLGVEQLDSLFKALNSRLKEQSEESLLGTKPYHSAEDERVTLSVAIVRHVVEVKLAEAAEKSLAKERKAKRQKLLEILESKKEGELQGLSMEELQKRLDELS